MRNPRLEVWEDGLNSLLRQVDNTLEEEFGSLLAPHPARPARGSTSNPQHDGLFRVTASFTAGFGSRHGKGYAVQLDTVSLERLQPELLAAVERRAVALIRSGLGKTFPGRGLALRRDGPVWKIIGDLSLAPRST